MHFKILFFMFYAVSFTSCQLVQEREPLASADLNFSVIGTPLFSTTPANVIFQSTDGGQTWQDVSKGLPLDKNIGTFLTYDDKVFLGVGNDVYQSNCTTSSPTWKKIYLHDVEIVDVYPGKNGMYARSAEKGIYKDIGNGIWIPTFSEMKDKYFRTLMESSKDSLFIGSDSGIFKSSDKGKSWKQVYDKGWMIHMVESDGVLLCTSSQGILRSADGGEHWDVVISEGGVGIAVEVIAGGFAAITYNTESKTRRVRISEDGGKTWQAIDAGLPPHALIASIKQMGNYFFCGHPDGIFRSADRGKTWKLILPAINKKVFNLAVSGKVIYAVTKDGGC